MKKARVFRRAIPGHSLKGKVAVTMTSRMARATMLTKARVPMGLSTRATPRARRATRPRRAQRAPRPMAFGYGLNMSHMSTPFQFPLKKVKNLSWMMMFMSRITHSLVFGPPTNQVALVIQVVLMVLVHRFPWWRCLMMIMSLQRNGHVSLTSQAMTLLFLTGAEPKSRGASTCLATGSTPASAEKTVAFCPRTPVLFTLIVSHLQKSKRYLDDTIRALPGRPTMMAQI